MGASDQVVVKTVAKRAPDGGWGWMVVLGASLANLTNQAIVSVFGLVYGDAIGQTEHGISGVALVMNIAAMVTNFSGIFTGPLLRNYSPRAMTMTGVLLTAAGLISSSCVSTLVGFIATYSVLTGLGLGLIMPASFMAVNAFFDKRKSQAVGISMAGTGLGQTVMPQVARFLLDEFEYRGTALIMGAISLHGLIGALLFQPIEWHLQPVAGDGEKCERLALLTPPPEANCEARDSAQVTATMCSVDEVEKENTPLRRIASALDLQLLKDPVFVHIIIGLSVVYTSSISFTMLFPFHLQSTGLSRSQTALSMSALSAADIVARLTIPHISGKLRLGSRTTFLWGAVMLGLSRILLTVQNGFVAMLAASLLCGFVRAATVINQNLTIAEWAADGRCVKKLLPPALGLNMVAKGIVVLTLGQLFGWVQDYSKSTIVCIQIQSVCLLFVAFTWTIELLHRQLTSPRVD